MSDSQSAIPEYLLPYEQASKQHRAGFKSLLWASRDTQAARFDAMLRLVDFDRKSILDAGCGRADLYSHLQSRSIEFADYTGLEAVESLAKVARELAGDHVRIITGDFVTDPTKLFIGADIIAFSGSLNTLQPDVFKYTLRRAYDACAEAVVFNFLSSPLLAAADYLRSYDAESLMRFCRLLSPKLKMLDDYLDGDTTIAIFKVE